MVQWDLSDGGKPVQVVQRILGQVWHCSAATVQQTARYLQGVLPGPAEPLQDTQAATSLENSRQLELHPANSHAANKQSFKKHVN